MDNNNSTSGDNPLKANQDYQQIDNTTKYYSVDNVQEQHRCYISKTMANLLKIGLGILGVNFWAFLAILITAMISHDMSKTYIAMFIFYIIQYISIPIILVVLIYAAVHSIMKRQETTTLKRKKVITIVAVALLICELLIFFMQLF